MSIRQVAASRDPTLGKSEDALTGDVVGKVFANEPAVVGGRVIHDRGPCIGRGQVFHLLRCARPKQRRTDEEAQLKAVAIENQVDVVGFDEFAVLLILGSAQQLGIRIEGPGELFRKSPWVDQVRQAVGNRLRMQDNDLVEAEADHGGNEEISAVEDVHQSGLRRSKVFETRGNPGIPTSRGNRRRMQPGGHGGDHRLLVDVCRAALRRPDGAGREHQGCRDQGPGYLPRRRPAKHLASEGRATTRSAGW